MYKDKLKVILIILDNYKLFYRHFLGLIELDVILLKDIKHNVFWFRAVSSVGRASRLHRGGQRFESFTAHQNESQVGV